MHHDADFPPGFMFGAATAAHQVEGGNVGSDWWEWEHREGTPAKEPSGDAIDHYHRYPEDFALLAGLGHNAHRLSIEWARIEPAPGEWSQAALDHYARVLTSLAEHGLTALATLQHFTLPRWFAERGGWLAEDAADRFGAYVAKVAETLGDLMPYACTINEPQIAAVSGYLTGAFPPGHTDLDEWQRVTHTLIHAHRVGVEALRTGPSRPRAGICLQLPAFEPARPDDSGCAAACEFVRAWMQDVYVDALRERPEAAGDFVGVQYYTRELIDPSVPDGRVPVPDGEPVTQMGWGWHPDGLRLALHTAARAGLPLIVTENGIATPDDTERTAFLDVHLRATRRAMDEGCDVRGYVHWSAFDNFEWNEGYAPTFGLVGIDYTNRLHRVIRSSAEAFCAVARTGRIAALSPWLGR
ncbi:MAG: glycoside hydrolase family 1 protein [Streptosporangiaceae bacterium]